MAKRPNAIWVSRIDELLAEKSRVTRRDWRVEDLANFVGVSRQTVQTWKSLSGMKAITAWHTAKMMEFFGCQEWQLWELVVLTEDEKDPAALAVA